MSNNGSHFKKKELSTAWDNRSQMFLKIGVLKNFANIEVKHLYWILLQAWRSSTLIKRDYNTSVFLWHLQKQKTFFTKHIRWLVLDGSKIFYDSNNGCNYRRKFNDDYKSNYSRNNFQNSGWDQSWQHVSKTI